MGHGASAAVKKGSVRVVGEMDDHSDPKPVWTRSNSDGCIVESLNSSKTKVDLLEMQVNELRELLRSSEVEHKDAEDKANTLEKQLAEVEGVNFELTDRISDLEQQLESLQAASGSEVNIQLEQELVQSTQEVEKLQMHIKLLEEQMTSMRSKFRKKLRAANTQVTEVKQESSLKLYSLKDQIKQLEEENARLSERLDRANVASSGRKPNVDQEAGGEDSRTMVILELSNQVSSQEDQLAELGERLEQRDKTIADLTLQLSQQRPPSRPASEASSRPPSGRNRQTSSNDKRVSVSDRKGSGGSRGRSLTEESASESSMEFVDRSKEGTGQSCDGRLGGESVPEDGGPKSSARRRRRESSGEDKDSGSSDRRHSASRERRRSASKDRKREKKGGENSTEGISSSDYGTGMDVESQKRRGSGSRRTRKENISDDSSVTTSESTSSSCTNSTVNDFHRTELKGKASAGRTCSAGSRDSAFHDGMEEGTKSAPCSAGSTRMRQRLKAGKQRAASMEIEMDGGKPSSKEMSRTSANFHDRDSGLDETRPNSAPRSSNKASDQELDDLLQELMGDDQTVSSRRGGWSRNDGKHGQKTGISEEKIRSLLADGAT